MSCGSASSTTEPPLPPSPPLGPPRSTNFSRLNATAPFPPSPALTEIRTRSTNFMVGPRAASPLAPERPRESLRASGVHRHLLALFTKPLVLHDAIDGRIQS